MGRLVLVRALVPAALFACVNLVVTETFLTPSSASTLLRMVLRSSVVHFLFKSLTY